MNTTCDRLDRAGSLSFWIMAQSGGAGPRSRPGGESGRRAGAPAPAPTRAGASSPTQPGRSRGSRQGRLGVAIVAGGAAIGAGATIATDGEPGLLLGLFLIAATIVAALVVALRSAYVLIPVPALAYTAAALLAGYVHDRSTVDTSLTGLAVSAVQWIADGFFAMSAATLIAILVPAGRWMFTGPGARRAYREPRRGTRPQPRADHRRQAGADSGQAGADSSRAEPEPPSLPAASPRQSG
jgi:Domain of unknown function (DUF6542)